MTSALGKFFLFGVIAFLLTLLSIYEPIKDKAVEEISGVKNYAYYTTGIYVETKTTKVPSGAKLEPTVAYDRRGTKVVTEVLYPKDNRPIEIYSGWETFRNGKPLYPPLRAFVWVDDDKLQADTFGCAATRLGKKLIIEVADSEAPYTLEVSQIVGNSK